MHTLTSPRNSGARGWSRLNSGSHPPQGPWRTLWAAQILPWETRAFLQLHPGDLRPPDPFPSDTRSPSAGSPAGRACTGSAAFTSPVGRADTRALPRLPRDLLSVADTHDDGSFRTARGGGGGSPDLSVRRWRGRRFPWAPGGRSSTRGRPPLPAPGASQQRPRGSLAPSLAFLCLDQCPAFPRTAE